MTFYMTFYMISLRNGLTTRCFRWSCHEKVKKHRTGAPQSYRSMFFFDLFMTAPSRMPTFVSVSGRHLSRKALKSRHSIRSCHEKVKKTLYRSTTRVTKYCKTHLKRAKMIPSPDPSHGLRHGTTPTRAGGQDDVSSNKLPQTINFEQYILSQ